MKEIDFSTNAMKSKFGSIFPERCFDASVVEPKFNKSFSAVVFASCLPVLSSLT